MSQLPYRKPDQQDKPIQNRQRAQRTLWIGMLIFVISILLMASPLVLAMRSLGKYVIAFGFFGACWGISVLLHGGWDWMRSKP